MSLIDFICCDVCNREGIRFIDRRGPSRSGDGRRATDGRSFFDGTEREAITAGWQVENGRHICPVCRTRLQTHATLPDLFDAKS